MQWSYSGETDGEFSRGRPVGRSRRRTSITVQGVTIVTDEEGERWFERYIDWAHTFAQLGLTVSWRRVVAEAIVGNQ